MDIDLLFTPEGECGLLSGGNLVQKVAGVIFSTENGMLTFEYADMDYLDLNIPVEADFHGILDFSHLIHIGAYSNDHIAQAYQVPFMIADDPYRAEMAAVPPPPGNPLLAFEAFIRRCTKGQPVHREDLGDEETMGCILGDAVPSSLEFAPHLARRRNFEAAPKLAPNAPGMGLGTSGSSGGGGTVSDGSKKDPKSS